MRKTKDDRRSRRHAAVITGSKAKRKPRTDLAGREKRVGLARALSKLGFCSRSHAAALIRAGRVRLNGTLRRDPETPVHPRKDRIEVDGKRVKDAARYYFMLNKPRGIITSAEDEKGRDTVYSLLPAGMPWVAPVGRLDKASEGLLLLTNDSEWAARVASPETHLEKIYHVQIGALAGEKLLRDLLKGFAVANGEVLRVKRAEILREGEKNSWLEVALEEGKNRHLRRMFEHRGIEVLRLIRVAIGPLALADLLKGTCRPLTPTEKIALDHAMQRNAGSARGALLPRSSDAIAAPPLPAQTQTPADLEGNDSGENTAPKRYPF
jgi:23S rRNA pseudouridine2605 synthase